MMPASPVAAAADGWMDVEADGFSFVVSAFVRIGCFNIGVLFLDLNSTRFLILINIPTDLS